MSGETKPLYVASICDCTLYWFVQKDEFVSTVFPNLSGVVYKKILQFPYSEPILYIALSTRSAGK